MKLHQADRRAGSESQAGVESLSNYNGDKVDHSSLVRLGEPFFRWVVLCVISEGCLYLGLEADVGRSVKDEMDVGG